MSGSPNAEGVETLNKQSPNANSLGAVDILNRQSPALGREDINYQGAPITTGSLPQATQLPVEEVDYVNEAITFPVQDYQAPTEVQPEVVAPEVVEESLPPEVISVVPEDQQTGLVGQDVQYHNPDINYDDAFVASNNQIVGELQPSNPEAITWIDPSFYTSQPIYSSSDFELGSSQTDTDYVTQYSADEDNEADIFANEHGAVIDLGYGLGEVDPALAAAAGYNTPAVITPSVDNVTNYSDYVTNYSDLYSGNSYSDIYGGNSYVDQYTGNDYTNSYADQYTGNSYVDQYAGNNYVDQYSNNNYSDYSFGDDYYY